jgi:DNA-binding beta-propeller fold protein YncE
MRRALVGSLVAVVSGLGACGSSPGNGGTGGSVGASGTGGLGAGTGLGGAGALGGSASGGTTGTGGAGVVTPPGAFSLVDPIQGSSAQPLTPDLQWSPADGADAYSVEIATSATFGSTDVVAQAVDGSAIDFTVPASTLEPGVLYYWRVTAQNAGGSTAATGGPQWFTCPYSIQNAHGIGVTPDGTRLVVASDGNNGPIDIITLASHEILSLGTGTASQPMGVAISPDGTEALATLLTNGSGGINGVVVIDLTTATVLGTVSDPCVGTTLSDVAYFPDGTTAALPDLSAGCGAMGLNTFSPTIGSSSFSFVNFNDTNDPLGIAIDPTGTFALVTMEFDDRLYMVTFPGTVSHLSLSSGSAGVAITPDGTTAVVASATADLITISDGSVTPVALMGGDTPNSDFHDVAITPDGTEAVIVGMASVQVISLASKSIAATYPASGGTSVAISPDGATAFVTDTAHGWVRLIPLP